MYKLKGKALDAALKRVGMHSDGYGLFLRVRPSGSAQWFFVTTRGGKRREIGLGGYNNLSIGDARKRAQAAREAVERGEDPVAAVRPSRAVPSFGQCADELVESMSKAWKNEKHRQQWVTTLTGEYDTGRVRIDHKAHASHVTALKALRTKRIDQVVVADILSVLKPIWQEAPETASRLRGRLENVLSYAKAHGHRSGENPAAWRGHLDAILPARDKLSRSHQKALDYREIPTFMENLRSLETISRLCLEFVVLTGVRSGEARGLVWQEVDLTEKLWTIPAKRMKAGKPHTVPLSDRAFDILEQMMKLRTSDFVFGGRSQKTGLSDAALSKVAKEVGGDISVHGFRSCLRDWAGDKTSHPREIIEHALAHSISDKTEAAYRRSTALEKRRLLMQQWSDYCSLNKEKPSNVIGFKL